MSGVPHETRRRSDLVAAALEAGRAAVGDRVDPDLIVAAIQSAAPNQSVWSSAYRAVHYIAGWGKHRSFPQWLASPHRTPDEVRGVFTGAVGYVEMSGAARTVTARSGGRCEARVDRRCQGAAHDFHHVQFRSQGGRNHASNLLHVCKPCHKWVHRNIAAAIERGLAHPDTPLTLVSKPTCWYVVVYNDGRPDEVMSRNKARKVRQRNPYSVTIARLPPDDPRCPTAEEAA